MISYMHIFEIHVRSYIFEIHVHARILFAKEKFTYKKCETSAVSHGVISNRSVIRLVFGSSSSELSRSVNIRLITCTKVLSTCNLQIKFHWIFKCVHYETTM